MPIPISAKRVASDAFARLPLGFEAQATESGGQYLARTDKWNVHLTATEAALVWRTDAGIEVSGRNAQPPTATLRIQMVGANPRARLAGENQLATQTNYFIGNDAKQWRTKVPNYARVKAAGVYPGIDAIYYGDDRQLEYDFDVAPQANAKAIRLRFAGAHGVRVDESGDLVIETSGGEVRQHRPLAYQVVNGSRREVVARFIATGRGEVGFAPGRYDHNLPLVIDPVIDFATVFNNRVVTGMALDAAGNIYLAGSVPSEPILPASAPKDGSNRHPAAKLSRQSVNAVQARVHENQVFIEKLDPTGSVLIYETYIGGSSQEIATGIALDAAGNAYVTGQTYSRDFPVTPGAFQTVLNNGAPDFVADAFVVKLSPSGTVLIYSTLLGSNADDSGAAIAVDATGNAYVTGSTTSPDFPLQSPFQAHYVGGPCGSSGVAAACADGFITKLNANGSGLIYSSFFGGSGGNAPTAIALDATGSAYITGTTTSADFPVTDGAFQRVYRGGVSFVNSFVLKVNVAGTALDYSTYFGGGGNDSATGIAVDSSGSAYVTGETASSDFPVTAQALQTESANRDLFRSTNGGANWQIHGDDLPTDANLADLVIDPVTPTTLYVSTSIGIFKSTDGGASWQRTAFTRSATLMAIDRKHPATLYATVPIPAPSAPFPTFPSTILVKTTDGGASWKDISPTPGFERFISNIYDIAIDPQDTNTLYVTTDGRFFSIIFKSTNGGQTWKSLPKKQSADLPGATDLAIDPNHPETLYAVASAMLYRSLNGGLKWKPMTYPGDMISLTVSPTDSKVLYAATRSGVWKSMNGGKRWQRLDDLPVTGDIGRVEFDPLTPSTIYALGNVAFKSIDNGVTWTAINTDLSDGKIYLLAIDPKNPSILYAKNANTGGTEAFVTRLNATGSGLIFSTYLGGKGSSHASALTLDTAGNAYILGFSNSPDFPLKDSFESGLHQGGSEAFVTEIDSTGSAVIFSTLLRMSLTNGFFPAGLPFLAGGIALDSGGNIYTANVAFASGLPGQVTPRRFGTEDGPKTFLLKITRSVANLPAPEITAVSPTIGLSTGGTEITISGSGFQSGATVQIDRTPALEVRFIDSTILKAIAPPSIDTFRSLDVTVINPDGQSFALVESFSYAPPPVITEVSIDGQDLIVKGLNFDKGSGILIDGVRQITVLDFDRTGGLIAQEAGNQIKPGQTVTLTVQNFTDFTSEPFVFTRPQ